VAIEDELARARSLAAGYVGDGDAVSGVLASEPSPGDRTYVCSVDAADGKRSWVAVRADGSAVRSRSELRAAVSVAAMCEIAVDAAAGGDVDQLIASLVDLREREAPEGIELAEARARELRDVLGEVPQLASPARLDAIGAAVRTLELELDPSAPSAFALAMRGAQGAVAELQREIEAGYLLELEP
jgi:hypothetical protein